MSFDFKKAKQSFDNLSFKNRSKAILNLVKNTFTIIGRDTDILAPWIRMAIYNFVMVTAFFYAVLGYWNDFPAEGWMLALSILLFIYKHFYHNKQEIRLSWTVYETIIGNDPSYKGAKAASKEVKSQTRKLAWMDIGMGLAKNAKSNKGGLVNKLINMFIEGMEEVWDLINHYLLPSVAVDNVDISPGIKKMKKLKDQVPETLLGVFGIDFLGDVVNRITRPIYLGLFVIAALLGYFGTGYFPSFEVPFEGNPITITAVPLVIAIFIGKLFKNLLERTVTSIKVIYFTVFYTKITHPERILDELQEELVAYLKLDQVDEVENLEEQEQAEGTMEPATA